MFRILLPLVLALTAFVGVGQTIDACVHAATGDVRILKTGQHCAAGEEPLQWGVVGIQGQTGPAGPAGPAGATGARGPQGIGDIGCATGQMALWEDGGGLWQCADPPDIAAQESKLVALQSEVAALKTLLTGVTREDGGTTLRISGANLQVVSGAGTTDGVVNGLGNIIIGYNERRGDNSVNVRSGSHMLVLGTQQNYSGFGGIVAGRENQTAGAFASILGGSRLVMHEDANASVLVGGFENEMHADFSVILGGSNHRLRASAAFSTIFGGDRIDTVLSGGAFGNYITCVADIVDPLGSCPDS